MSDDEEETRRRLAHDRTLLSDLPPPPAAGTFRTTPDTSVTPLGATHALDPQGNVTLPSADELPLPAPADLHPGMVIAGKYELLELLGRGGMGKVWKSLHLGLGVPVAVKTMHQEIARSTDYVRRFRREAHAASLMNHPNAVRVLDFGDDGGTLYMVMELLEGKSLTRWLNDFDDPPPLADVAEILGQLLDAFQVAHAHGIVHRDLKPDNVFLTSVSGKRVVKVLDFGLAHVEDKRDQGPTLTAKDVIAGTPEYMSPEQCRSLAVGPSADIYSIGCLLTEMLQLRPLFTGSAAIEVLAKQMFSPPPELARPAGAPPVPPLLERLRLDLLAKTPEKRPADPVAVKARLLEAMSPEATEARLPTRKGDEPLGDRASRAPRWEAAESAPVTTRTRLRAVGVLRLAREEGGVTEIHETGLASHKIETVFVRSVDEAQANGLSVLLLDAGSRLDEAVAVLGAAKKGCRVVVCAADLTTERMNTLVGAGAADVIRYPVTADTLARKLERVIRRGR